MHTDETKPTEITLLRTNSQNADFQNLIKTLDAFLWSQYGEAQQFYSQFNSVVNIKNVVVAYSNDEPIGCGAFKKFDETSVEIKRMFVAENYRGSAAASNILHELETWAKELNYTHTTLEVGKKQPRAIRFYERSGYESIENYGQYIGVETSLCMKKKLFY